MGYLIFGRKLLESTSVPVFDLVYQTPSAHFYMGCSEEVGAVTGSVEYPVTMYMVPLKSFSQSDCPLTVRSVVLCRIRSSYIWPEKRYVLVDENDERVYPYAITEMLNACFGSVSVFDPRNRAIFEALAELLQQFPGPKVETEPVLSGAAYLFANEFPRLAFMLALEALTPELLRPLDSQMEHFLELFCRVPSINAFIDRYFFPVYESTSVRLPVYRAFVRSWKPRWVTPWLLWFIAWRMHELFQNNHCLLVEFLTRSFRYVPLPDDWDVFSVLLEEVVRQASDESAEADTVVKNLIRAMEYPESGREAV